MIGRPSRVRASVAVPLAALAFGALALAWLVALPGQAQAAGPVKRITQLTVQVPATFDLGAHPTVRVRLTSGGAVVPGALVSIHLDGRVTKQLTTGRDGSAATDIARELPAGRYFISASFAGTPTYQSSSSATAAFTIRPVRLVITTVPPTPGLRLVRLGNGSPLTTGADGTVQATIGQVGDVALRLVLQSGDPTRRYQLAQWDDGSTDQVRTIRIPDTLKVTVGVETLFPVQVQLASADGTPTDPSSISRVRVSDSSGREVDLAAPGPTWLRADAINRPPSGLTDSPLEYRVMEVPMGGVNVVNQGQQRFTLSGPFTLQVNLLIFNLGIQGRDALLRMPAGLRATITQPDGTQQVVALDGNGHATLQLPRGEYRVVLGGGSGIALSTPVALSRDQTLEPLVISLLDIAIVIVAALVLAIGLVIVGRPHLVRLRPAPVAKGSAARTPAAAPVIPAAPPEARVDAAGVPFPRADAAGGAAPRPDGSGSQAPPQGS